MLGIEHCDFKRDAEFEQLIQPLTPLQWTALEAQILAHGCGEPVYTWRSNILDGQERLELCHRLQVSCVQEEIALKSREDVIIWICVRQGKREDLTAEMQKYLIGKRYAAEKILTARRMIRHNQYSKSYCNRLRTLRHDESQHRTAEPIGKEYGICYATVQKYGAFALAVDQITRTDDSLRVHFLSGKTKISHENVVLIANMNEAQIKQLALQLKGKRMLHLQTEDILQTVGQRPVNRKFTKAEAMEPSVKHMPTYNPDTEVSGLCLTIPSWRSSIGRIQSTVGTQTLTSATKENLKNELLALRETMDCMLGAIGEGQPDE